MSRTTLVTLIVVAICTTTISTTPYFVSSHQVTILEKTQSVVPQTASDIPEGWWVLSIPLPAGSRLRTPDGSEFPAVSSLNVSFSFYRDASGNESVRVHGHSDEGSRKTVILTARKAYEVQLEFPFFDQWNGQKAVFRGAFAPGSYEVSGEFVWGDFQEKAKVIRGDKRIDEPPISKSYECADVSYTNPDHTVTYSGSLMLPKRSPIVAVMLVQGEGSIDRDGRVASKGIPNPAAPRWLYALADHLAKSQFAVLRVDGRGVGGTTGMPTIDPNVLATDILAGIQFLRQKAGVRHIGVIAHSRGAIPASIAARREPTAFIVLLGAPALEEREHWLAVDSLLARTTGVSNEVSEDQQRVLQTLFDARENQPSEVSAQIAMTNAFSELRRELQIDVNAWYECPDFVSYLISRFAMPKRGNWYRASLIDNLRDVTCPIVFVYGAKDHNVPCEANARRVKDAIANNVLKNSELVILDGLNHCFQECRTGLPEERAVISQTLSPKLMAFVSEWIIAEASNLETQTVERR